MRLDMRVTLRFIRQYILIGSLPQRFSPGYRTQNQIHRNRLTLFFFSTSGLRRWPNRQLDSRRYLGAVVLDGHI
jgi:hypothetical protein